jgi:hypothetical protein
MEGLEVRAVIENNLAPQGVLNPNDAHLGANSVNAWGLEQTQRTIAILQSLGPHLSPAILWAGNEPNVQAADNPQGDGSVIKTLKLGDWADPRKPEAMSPEAYFTFLHYFASMVKAHCWWVKTIYPAALSCAVNFQTSEYDDWIGGYIDKGMAALHNLGLQPPWPWDGLSLNMEGNVSPEYAKYTAFGLSQHKKEHQIQGPTVIGEWGIPAGQPNKPVDEQAASTTFKALNQYTESMSFFAAHITGGYGCMKLGYDNGVFIPGDKTDWLPRLKTLLENLP